MEKIDRKTSTSSIYFSLNSKNMNKDCPGSKYDRKTDISIMILEKSEDSKEDFYLRDITYMNLDDAYQKYIIDNSDTYPEPFNRLFIVYPDILKNRIISQVKYRNLILNNKSFNLRVNDENYKNEIFIKYCSDMILEEERCFLDNNMYFDDHLIDWTLSSDLDLREKAISIICNSTNGSWLVRRSSIKEQEHVKIRVITCRCEDEIRNYLIAHINGFGYVLTNGIQGSSIPSLGEDKTIKIHIPFYSFPSLLDYISLEGIKLDKIIKNNKDM